MAYEYCASNPERFATNLQYDQPNRRLIWDSAKGQEVMLVKTPFGKNVLSACDGGGAGKSIIEDLCAELEKIELRDGCFTEVRPGIWVRFMKVAEYTKLNGCPLHGEASTYSVLACDRKDDLVRVYAPQEQAMIKPFCNIPLNVKIEIKRDVVSEKRLFRTVEVETGFYKIFFPEGLDAGYVDGSLQCLVGDIVIPVTKAMLKCRTSYIEVSNPPAFSTDNGGLHLT